MDGPTSVVILQNMVDNEFDLDLLPKEVEALKFAISTIESIIEAHEVNEL